MSKYEQYIQKNPLGPKLHDEQTADIVSLRGAHWDNLPINLRFEVIDNPFMLIKEPHTHTFHQFLGFIGGDVMNPLDFTAEVDLFLGEELEKQVIDYTCIVHIPPGLVHGPLDFVKIDKPIRFYDIALTPEYKRTPYIQP
jgi:hypothetical protein